jgi:hypothetical protein
MKDDRYIELVNREISGEITPEESAELERYLGDNPDAARVRRQLQETSALLGGVGDVEPPPHLKRHIMNQIDFNRYRTEERRPVLNLLGRARRLGLRPRLVYAFAAGVAVGLVLFTVFLTGSWDRYSPDLSGLYATIGVSEDAGFSTIEQLPLDLPGAEGLIGLMRSADLLIFEVSLKSTRQYEVRVLFDPAEVRFNGLRPEVGWRSLAEVGEGRVSASGSGEGRFQLSLTKVTESALPIDFELLVSGNLVFEHRFEVAAGGEHEK